MFAISIKLMVDDPGCLSQVVEKSGGGWCNFSLSQHPALFSLSVGWALNTNN